MGAGNQSIRGLPAASTTQKVYNVMSPGTANTEFSQVLTDGTKQIIIRSRAGGKIQFSFNSGESGTTFLTIEGYSVYEKVNLNLEGATLYMQTDMASEVVEIEEWS